MKRDPIREPRNPDAVYMGFSIFKIIGGRGEATYRKPGGITREAKSVSAAMAAIARLEGKVSKSSGAVSADGPVPYRIERDRMALEVSRKVVEAREKRHA
jgi:hypothetical protein